MGETQIFADLAATRRRRARLGRYVARELLHDYDFICRHAESCMRSADKPGHVFRPAVMSHVGRRYDLVRDGKPLRIMVVGQESGLPKDPDSPYAERVSLGLRYQQVHDDSGLQRRFFAEQGHPGRNPHMRGTTSALRILLGKPLGTDFEGETVRPVQGRPFHLFDGFALVNRLLCSTGPVGTSQGAPTRTMFDCCGEHFSATLAILQPTIMVLQGSAVTKGVAAVLPSSRVHSNNLHEARIGDQRVLVCSFSHPSAHGALRWGGSPTGGYLQDVVVPTLRTALTCL